MTADDDYEKRNSYRPYPVAVFFFINLQQNTHTCEYLYENLHRKD